MNRFMQLTLTLLACGALMLAGCTDEETVTPPTGNSFVGSATCGTVDCHETIHSQWEQSGHPYKLTKINGEAPTNSFPGFAGFPTDPVDPPVGLEWADISYTIGGYGWKMRWIDNDGYIVTGGLTEPYDDVQHNFEDQSWATYHGGEAQGTKPYNCGKCHTTGWIADDDWETDGTLADNQDNLPGMHGTFFAGGVHCEECHGMGADHIASGDAADMTIDTSSAMCGRCHTRDSANRIQASGGFIKHHEQYDEWLHSPHGVAGSTGPGCNDCHDPHASVKYDVAAAGEGVLPAASCESCHPVQAANNTHNGAPTCTDCHMPKASKSAIKLHAYSGDIKTHILKINTAAIGNADGMYEYIEAEDKTFVQTDAEGLASITLDFACYGCHRDENEVGGSNSIRTLQQLSDKAMGIHTPAAKVSQR